MDYPLCAIRVIPGAVSHFEGLAGLDVIKQLLEKCRWRFHYRTESDLYSWIMVTVLLAQ